MTEMKVEETEMGPIPGEPWCFLEHKAKMIKDKPDSREWQTVSSILIPPGFFS